MNDHELKKHMQEDHEFQEGQSEFNQEMKHMLLGNKDTGEIGMKEKVDAMYEILTNVRGVGGFFNLIKSWLGFIIIMAAVWAIIKGWRP